MTLYYIQARVLGEYPSTGRDCPTFVLDSEIQGIVSSVQAAKIARDIVDAYFDAETVVTVWDRAAADNTITIYRFERGATDPTTV